MVPREIASKPRPNKEKFGHQHGEAFCHMLYISEDGREMEWLWNSRDGVTPFIIRSRSGKQMEHSFWNDDRVDRDYKPVVGDRIFIDATREDLQQQAVEYVDKCWHTPQYPMCEMFASKEEAIEAMLQEWCKPGSPNIVEVTEGWLEKHPQFKSSLPPTKRGNTPVEFKLVPLNLPVSNRRM